MDPRGWEFTTKKGGVTEFTTDTVIILKTTLFGGNEISTLCVDIYDERNLRRKMFEIFDTFGVEIIYRCQELKKRTRYIDISEGVYTFYCRNYKKVIKTCMNTMN